MHPSRTKGGRGGAQLPRFLSDFDQDFVAEPDDGDEKGPSATAKQLPTDPYEAFAPPNGVLREKEVAPFVFSHTWEPLEEWGPFEPCYSGGGPTGRWGEPTDDLTGLPCLTLHFPKIGLYVKRSLVPVHGHD